MSLMLRFMFVMIVSASAPCFAAYIQLYPAALETGQAEALNDDQPLSAVFVDHQDSIWITGKLNLWRWDPLKKLLSKIPLLATESDDALSHIAPLKNGLVVASRKSIFQIEISPKKITRYDFPSQNPGKTITVQADRFGIWWLKHDTLIHFDPKNENPGTISIAPLGEISRAWIDSELGLIWLIKGGQILTLKLSDPNRSPKLIHQLGDAFIDIKSSGSHVFVDTNHVLLQFDRVGFNLVKAVPVSNLRKLLSFHVTERSHSFLFSDTKLEVYRVKEKTKFESKVALPSGMVVEAMAVGEKILAVLSKNQISGFVRGAILKN